MPGSTLTVVTGQHGAGPQFPCEGCAGTPPMPRPGPSLTAGVGDGDRHTLDLDTVDVDGVHGLSCRRQLSCTQADDAPGRGDLWQGTLFPENCC